MQLDYLFVCVCVCIFRFIRFFRSNAVVSLLFFVLCGTKIIWLNFKFNHLFCHVVLDIFRENKRGNCKSFEHSICEKTVINVVNIYVSEKFLSE
jgi:hypothetical protein